MRKRVLALIEKYKKRLCLEIWDFSLELSGQDDDGHHGVASIDVNYVYKTGHIVIYKCAFKKPNELEHIIKHELCHCLTEPLYVYCHEFLNGKFRTHDDINEQREILTEWIAKLVR